MWWILTAFLILFSPFNSQANAATTPKSAITVAPSIVRLDLQTDKPQTTLTYINTTNKNLELSLSASDFKQLEEGYKVSYLEGKDAKNYKYSLSSWIDFDKKNLILSPGQKGQITVFINNKALTPGGHYATILAQVSQKSSTTDNVAIQGVLSSLLFVRTNTGREIEKGKIQSFEPSRSFLDFPQKYSFWFQNSGDTDLTPYGLIEIKDPFGGISAKGIINDGSLITLPESIRRYDVAIVKNSPLLLPGIYHAELNLHFGKSDKKLKTTSAFFSQGSIPLLPLLLIIIVLGFLLYKKKRPS